MNFYITCTIDWFWTEYLFAGIRGFCCIRNIKLNLLPLCIRFILMQEVNLFVSEPSMKQHNCIQATNSFLAGKGLTIYSLTYLFLNPSMKQTSNEFFPWATCTVLDSWEGRLPRWSASTDARHCHRPGAKSPWPPHLPCTSPFLVKSTAKALVRSTPHTDTSWGLAPVPRLSTQPHRLLI
jgi:hypothetical protein